MENLENTNRSNENEQENVGALPESSAENNASGAEPKSAKTDKTAEELVAERLSRDGFAELAGEDELYSEAPNAKQAEYIRALVCGVADHAPELDEFIARYAKGWSFDRIPLVASAIMRVAMYEILYFRDVPNSVAINEAVEIAKKYETPETVKFINGILGSFVRAEISAE